MTDKLVVEKAVPGTSRDSYFIEDEILNDRLSNEEEFNISKLDDSNS